jgi:hypothetical protein
VRFSSPLIAGALLTAATLGPAIPASARTIPIQVQQCFVTVPKAMSSKASGTQIVYVNRGRMAASHVTFAVGYRNAAGHYLRRVTDDGTFAPGAVINHHFALYNDVTYAGKHVTACSPVGVIWANGMRWTM